MKVTFSDEKINSLLERKELELEIEHSASPTPAKAALQQYISKEKNVEPERIEIMSIISSKGKNVSKSLVYVWNNKKVGDLSKPKEAPAEKTE